MQHLVGNIWIHDPGSGEVSVYERIGRNYRPIRAESEELPDRIPFEARQVIKARLKEAASVLNNRTPKEVRLANLERALQLFPAYTDMSDVEKERFRERLSIGIPDTWEDKPPETLGLQRPETVEEQVEKANKLKLSEIDQNALRETELLRAKEETRQLQLRLAELEAKVNGQASEES